MAKKVLELVLVGDEKDLTRALGKASGATSKFAQSAETHSHRAGRAFMAVGKGAGLAGAAIGVGVVVGLKKSVDAAVEAEKSQARLEAQLKASGVSYGKHKAAIDRSIAATSKLSALDDEDLTDSFTNIFRVTGDVNKSLELNAIAADIARAKHIDVAKAGELVGKVAGGNVGILARYGIVIKKGSTATEALGQLQGKFAGQAKAYGDTTAGAQEKFQVATENLQEAIGSKLAPALAGVTQFAANFVTGISDGTGAGGKFRDVVVDVWKTVQGATSTAVGAIKTFLTDHKTDIESVEDAFSNLGKAIAFVWEKVALPIIQRVLPAIKQIIDGNLKIIGGIVKVFAGILTGDFGKAWDGVKDIFSGALKVILGTLRAATAPFRQVAAMLGGAIIDGLKSIGGALVDAADWVKDKFLGVLRGYVGAYGAAGRFVLDKVRDGIKGAGEFLGDAADWLLAKLTGFIHGVGSGFKDVGSFIVDKIGDGLKGGLNAIVGFVNKIISVINKIPGVDIKPIAKASADEVGGEDLAKGALGSGGGLPLANHNDRKGGLPDKILGGITGALSPSKLVGDLPHPDLPPMMGDLGGYLIDKVKDFIKDKLKDVLSIGTGSLNPGSLDKITALASRFGLTMTSGYRPGDDGYHGVNRARDYSDGYATPKELAFARLMAGAYGGKLLELIHTPLGFGIKNGRKVDTVGTFGAAVAADHYDHVHVAMEKGGYVQRAGWAVVGERGPELAHLPGGSTVFSNADSKRMAGTAGGWGGDINLAPGGTVRIGSQVDLRREMNRVAFSLQTA